MPFAAARLKSASATTISPVELSLARSVSAAIFAMAVDPKSNTLTTGSSLCNLCVLCVSVVKVPARKITTETQRTQRLHREEFITRRSVYAECRDDRVHILRFLLLPENKLGATHIRAGVPRRRC